MEELARIESTPAVVADAIRVAALHTGDPRTAEAEMFVRVTGEAVETPASAAGSDFASYCTVSAKRFDRLVADEPVAALFPVGRALSWLAWFDDDEPITLRFIGEPGAEVVTALVIDGERRAARISCTDDPSLLEGVEVWLPGRFDGDRFLDADGSPLPTRVETDASVLSRITDTVDRLDGAETYPLQVSDGALQLSVDSGEVQASEQFEATVEGPDLDQRYGPAFARIAETVESGVTLQTGPDRPLVVYKSGENFTLRYFVAAVDG